MSLRIDQINPDKLNIYASIPMSFWVNSIYRIEPMDEGLSGLRLVEQPIQTPWIKDYDSDESPLDWPKRFNLKDWGIFILFQDNTPAAGAAIVMNCPEVNSVDDRKDLGILCDIRVHPDQRGKGLGRMIFNHAAAWIHSRGCTQLKIETQNVNVPACKFYKALGCELGMIHKYGYAHIPASKSETALFWYLTL